MTTLSIVIPVYNVASFIERTIKSVLAQPEVTEIVVVDDGSKDETLNIINHLQKDIPYMKVFQHKDGLNKGRGATRNLGIKKATGEYLAFLDADDYYLEKRFVKDIEILDSGTVDGVYNAVGFHFYREKKKGEEIHYKLNTINKVLSPEELFSGIVKSKFGFLHLNGITVRRDLFSKIGLMNEALLVTQDTDIIFKMALGGVLAPSSIYHPVALRGVHNTNVFVKDDLYKKFTPLMYESVLRWSFSNMVSNYNIDLILDALWQYKFKLEQGLLHYHMYWLRYSLRNPKLFLTVFWLKYLPLVRLRKKMFPLIFK